MRFEVAAQGLRKQFIEIADPALFDECTRIRDKLFRKLSLNCSFHKFI